MGGLKLQLFTKRGDKNGMDYAMKTPVWTAASPAPMMEAARHENWRCGSCSGPDSLLH